MKPKPPGKRYRNLYVFRDSIWYERRLRGNRFRLDTETTSWQEAAERRDAYEDMKGVQGTRARRGQVPTFAEFTLRYLKEDTGHLLPTTRGDRYGYLRQSGPLLKHFGERRLDDITVGMLREWWVHGQSRPTGRPTHRPSAAARRTGARRSLHQFHTCLSRYRGRVERRRYPPCRPNRLTRMLA